MEDEPICAIEPEGIYERFASDAPVIFAMWHGQHFWFRSSDAREYRAKVLVSRHRDGEINAIAAERLGVGAVRGSGHHTGGFIDKGGVSGFKEMLSALEEGYNVALTADVPKVARVRLGIVKLASASGRPIYPVAIATHWRVELDNWDRTVINLPFGRGGRVAGEPVRVPSDADAQTLEASRCALEASLCDDCARLRHRGSAKGGTAAVPEGLPLTLHVYRLLTAIAAPLAPVLVSHRLKHGKEDAARVDERYGQSRTARPPSVWVHGASVGELLAVIPLIERIRERSSMSCAPRAPSPRPTWPSRGCRPGQFTSSSPWTTSAPSGASSTIGGPIWRSSWNPISGPI